MSNWRERHQVVPAVYVLLRDGDKILLLRRHNTGYRDGQFSLPAGHLDGGEPAVVAAAREAKEEVGVTIKPENLELVHTQHRVADSGDHERLNLLFEASEWEGAPYNAEPEKCSEIRWSSLDDLPSGMVIELEHFVRHLKSGDSYGDFGF